jgi:hypothetical protein
MRSLQILAWFGLLLQWMTEARIGTELTYPLKSRRNDQGLVTTKFNLEELPNYKLTYSDDSSPKALDPFIITLFETDGLLPLSPSLFHVESALQDYVAAELNAAYGPYDSIKFVRAKVLSQKSTATTLRGRSLQIKGSELELQVDVTFANEPSPDTADVDLTLKTVMQNMLSFLTNLTATSEGDRELENVHSAFRLEITAPTEPEQPTDSVDPGTDTPFTPIVGIEEPAETSKRGDAILTATLVFAACVATIFAGAMIIVRRKAGIAPESASSEPSYPGHGGHGVGVFWDEESDLFSFETALIDNSPQNKENKMRQRQRMSPDDKSGVFSGFSARKRITPIRTPLDENRGAFGVAGRMREIPLNSPGSDGRRSPTFSPGSSARDDNNSDVFSGVSSSPRRKGAGSVFSLFTNKTSGSRASTVMMSNTTKDKSGADLAEAAGAAVASAGVRSLSPHSRYSSLFTFSEESDEDLLSGAGEIIDILSHDEEEDNGNTNYVSSDGETNGAGANSEDDVTGTVELLSTRGEGPGSLNLLDRGRLGIGPFEFDIGIGPFDRLDLDKSDVAAFSVAAPNSARSAAPSDEARTPRSARLSDEKTPQTRDPFAMPVPKMKMSRSDESSGVGPQQIGDPSARTQDITSPSGARANFSHLFKSDTESSGDRSPSTTLEYNEPSNDLSTPPIDDVPDPSYPFRDFKKGANSINVDLIKKKTARAKNEAGSGVGGWTITLAPPHHHLAPRSARFGPNPVTSPEKPMSPASTSKKNKRNKKNSLNEKPDIGYFSDPGPLKKAAAKEAKRRKSKIQLVWGTDREESFAAKARRHTRSTTDDGTTNYQTETMDPQEWSLTSNEDLISCGSSNVPDMTPPRRGSNMPSESSSPKRKKMDPEGAAAELAMTRSLPEIPHSPDISMISALSAGSTTITDDPQARTEVRASRQLISDLVWLEKKIAAANNTVVSSPDSDDDASKRNAALDTSKGGESADSLSFRSDGDGVLSDSGSLDSTTDLASPKMSTPKMSKDTSLQGLQTILCRDCYAPPGKLKIVIHSTKDGPAVHTVKEGSSLQGHVFSGDLIISVDGVDTRSYTADQVMKMMTARTKHERKITVLHFEEGEEM